jgi:hypothetical protein
MFSYSGRAPTSDSSDDDVVEVRSAAEGYAAAAETSFNALTEESYPDQFDQDNSSNNSLDVDDEGAGGSLDARAAYTAPAAVGPRGTGTGTGTGTGSAGQKRGWDHYWNAEKERRAKKVALLLAVPFVSQLPAGVFLYWTTNSCFSISQSLLLRNPRFRKLIKVD